MATQAELLYVIKTQDQDLKRLQKEVRELNKELGKTGDEGARSLSDRLRSAGDTMVSTGKKATTHLTLPIVAAGVAAFKSFESIEQGQNQVTLATGATGKALERLHKAYRDAIPEGRKFGLDHEQIGKIVGDLNTHFGVTGPRLTSMAKDMARFSRAAGVDGAEAVMKVNRVMKDWGVETAKMPAVLDRLTVAGQMTGVSVDQLMENVVKFGVPMRNFGFTMDEAIALLSSFEQQGVNTNLVMGSLRIATGKFAKEGKDLKTGLWETIEAIKNAKTSSEAAAIGMEIFGARAGADMAKAIQEGRFNIDELVRALGDSGGATREVADNTVTASDRMREAFARIQLAVMPLGAAIAQNVSRALQVAMPWVQRVAEAFGRLPGPVKQAIVVLGMVAAAAGPLLIVAGKLVTAVAAIIPVVKALGAALSLLAANPIVLVIAAVAALAAGLIYAYKNSETFRAVVDGAISAVGKTIGAFAKFFTDAIPNAAKAVLDWTKRNWPAITTIISGPFAPLVALATDAFGVRSKLVGALTSLIGQARALAARVSDAVKSGFMAVVWDIPKALYDRIIQPMIDKVSAVFDRAKALSAEIPRGIRAVTWGLIDVFRDRIIDPLVNLATAAFNKGKDLAKDITRGIREGAREAWDSLVGAFKALLNRIIDVVNKIPFVNIPKLAEGGVIAGPTLAVVGEDGPEVVIPLSRKRRKRGMQLMTQAAQMMGVEGDWPGPVARARAAGIPMLANGGFVIPGQYQGAGLDALYRSALLAANTPNVLQRAAGVLAKGAGWLIGQLPTPRLGNVVLDGLARAVKDAATTAIRNAFESARKFNIDGITAAWSFARAQMGKPYVWGGGHGGWNYNLPGYDCCLVGETRVFGPDGVKRMDQLAPGDMVWSFVDGRLEAHRVTAAWFSKRQTVYAVRTRNRTVLASDNHPFLRIACTKPSRGGFAGPAEWNTEWARTDELAPGDLVVQLGDAPHTGETEVDLDLAWLAGLAVGDGTLTDKGLRLCVYGEARERADKIIRERTGARPFWRDDAGLVVSSAALRDELLAIGLQRARSHEKRVPAAVWRWREDAQRAFLDGYRDADGYSPKDQRRHGERTYASSSHDLVAEVRALHILLGDAVSNISTNQRRSPITIKGVLVKRARPLHSFTVWQAGARDGMHAVRSKQGLRRLLEEWGGRFVIARVLDITEMGERDTFDIEVEGSHNFVADGLVVHNSGFASHVAKKAGSSIGAPGTTMSLFPVSSPGRGPVMWGFRNMHIPDPRKQHMGAKVLGTWYQFGNPGRSGGGDGQWSSLRVPPGLASFRSGTPYVPSDGIAMLHKGEKVVPREGSLVHIENYHVHGDTDVEVLAAGLSRKLALRGVG